MQPLPCHSLTQKQSAKRLTHKFILIFSAIVVTAVTPIQSAEAIPMSYTVTGDVTGTITMDFMTSNQASNVASDWNLTYSGVVFTHRDPFTFSFRNLNTTFGVDDINIQSGELGFGRRINIFFFGPTFKSGLYSGGYTDGAAGTPLNGTFAPVPEPTTMLLFGTGLLGLAGYRWSQRRRERAQVG